MILINTAIFIICVFLTIHAVTLLGLLALATIGYINVTIDNKIASIKTWWRSL